MFHLNFCKYTALHNYRLTLNTCELTSLLATVDWALRWVQGPQMTLIHAPGEARLGLHMFRDHFLTFAVTLVTIYTG